MRKRRKGNWLLRAAGFVADIAFDFVCEIILALFTEF